MQSLLGGELMTSRLINIVLYLRTVCPSRALYFVNVMLFKKVFFYLLLPPLRYEENTLFPGPLYSRRVDVMTRK